MTYRITLIVGFFTIAYLALISRLFYWQVLRYADIKQIAAAQNSESITLPARRGSILASDDFKLATNKISYLLYANPKLVKDKDYLADKLSSLLDIPKASISAQLSKDLFWVKLANNLDMSSKDSIEGLRIKGLGFQENSLRYYPESSMAAQLVGFVGKDQNDQNRGYFGVEGYYDGQLKGRDGRLYVIHDALGNTILNEVREEKRIDGRDIALTIDRTIQYIAEKQLKDGLDQYEADGGSIVIMQPKTGKILAMASFPRFDPQKYYDFEGSFYKNPVISNLYEPGSTFKVLVMASAIDAGVVKPDTKCPICSQAVQIGEYKIKTWNDKYFPDTTMTEVLMHSDNTGMVYVGKQLGFNKFIQYLRSFGIGSLTGIDLEGETTGIIKDEKDWYPIDVATATFGQGISITPIQLITAVNAIANGGVLMKPYVVDHVITDEGKTIEVNPQIQQRPISEVSAKVMTEMMVNAVEKGEAKWTKLKNYKVAGKTGTAQIPVAGHYDPRNTLASFVGFFPADDPQITMLVLVDKPKKSIYGAETAAPIFFNTASEIINYYNIPPTY